MRYVPTGNSSSVQISVSQGDNFFVIKSIETHLYLKIVCIFAPTESATLPDEQRTRAGLLFYTYTKMPKKYTKPPISISEQIYTLKERGLIIDDIPFAEKILSEISYFRFAAYLR